MSKDKIRLFYYAGELSLKLGENEKAKGYLSVAVRIEKGIASKNAVVLTKEVIIPVLESLEYLKKN
jgi:hypothetical protein